MTGDVDAELRQAADAAELSLRIARAELERATEVATVAQARLEVARRASDAAVLRLNGYISASAVGEVLGMDEEQVDIIVRRARNERRATRFDAGATRPPFEALPAEVDEKVWQLYQDGLPPDDIAVEVGLPVHSVRRAIRAGAPDRVIQQLRERGLLTVNEAAAVLGVKKSSIRYRMERKTLPTFADPRRRRGVLTRLPQA